MGCHFLLRGIFLTQGSDPLLLHWQLDSLHRVSRECCSYSFPEITQQVTTGSEKEQAPMRTCKTTCRGEPLCVSAHKAPARVLGGVSAATPSLSNRPSLSGEPLSGRAGPCPSSSGSGHTAQARSVCPPPPATCSGGKRSRD